MSLEDGRKMLKLIESVFGWTLIWFKEDGDKEHIKMKMFMWFIILFLFLIKKIF